MLRASIGRTPLVQWLMILVCRQDYSLMIRNCYVEAEKLVWKNAVRLPKTGVIITGQPGIGMIISCISVCLHLY